MSFKKTYDTRHLDTVYELLKIHRESKDEELIKAVEFAINSVVFQWHIKEICSIKCRSVEDRYDKIEELVRCIK